MENKVPTQEQRVIQYLVDFGSITRLEALRDIGIANLPAVISDIRKHRGYSFIVTDEIKAKNRYGQKITYAKYSLGEEE